MVRGTIVSSVKVEPGKKQSIINRNTVHSLKKHMPLFKEHVDLCDYP